MKSIRTLVFLALAFFAATIQGFPQSFAIDWFTVDGGGGVSEGGGYSVNGSIAQSDPGPTLSGGSYSMTGGFWGLVAVQTPGAPQLKISFTATNTAVISWPAAATGFVLEQNGQLRTLGWNTAPQATADDGTNNFIIVNPSVGPRYYRLFKPN